jgi:dihydrofolate reductase
MRSVVLAMFTTLDGFIAGPNGELVPPPWSADAQTHWSDANLDLAGTVVYGRKSYEGMAQYSQGFSPVSPRSSSRTRSQSPAGPTRRSPRGMSPRRSGTSRHNPARTS